MAEREIVLEEQDSCEMARVLLDGKAVYLGNWWDFYEGCHGIPYNIKPDDPDPVNRLLARFPRIWRGRNFFVSKLKALLEEDGDTVTVIKRQTVIPI